MAQQSEAACLLQTGALYTRRLGLRPRSGGGDIVFAGFKHGAFSLYFGDEPIYHFDLEGRWQRAFIRGTHHLKALNTSVDALERIREGDNLVLHRRALGEIETSQLDESVRAMALALLESLGSDRIELADPPPPSRPIALQELRTQLESIARWDGAAWHAHRELYRGTYGPLGFLPPEAQQAVVLQATVGDAEGLTFGHAPASEHTERTAPEFEEHARRVSELVGKRMLQSRCVFLGGSDVLRLPAEQVASYLRVAARRFPIDPSTEFARLRDLPHDVPRLSGVCAFLDRFEPPLPDVECWRVFKQLHLTRVILGIESGDADVRDFFGKSTSNDACRGVAHNLKQAGIELSVVTLVGAGGREHAQGHLEKTSELITTLPLEPGDIVYLVDAFEVSGELGRTRLKNRGLTPLDPSAVHDQQERLLARLQPLRSSRKAKVVPYTLEKQWA